MNLSDEAVEAVLQVLSEHVDASECCARAALEAAAPHLASVWHDAVSAAYIDGALSADAASVMYEANPYRSAGAGE